MQKSTYELRYLPLFYEDLNDKVLYIAVEKQNPKAAADLVDKVEQKRNTENGLYINENGPVIRKL